MQPFAYIRGLITLTFFAMGNVITLSPKVNAADAAAISLVPAKEEILLLEHDLYWKGFHVITLNTEMTLKEGRYQTNMTWQTRGFLSLFVDGKSTAVVSGQFNDTLDIQAENYRSDGQWDDKVYFRELAFDDQGRVSIIAEKDPWAEERAKEAEKKERKRKSRRKKRKQTIRERIAVPEELKVGPDPISLALVTVLDPLRIIKTTHLASNDDRITPITSSHYASYDGRRSMAYNLGCDGTIETLKSSAKSDFSGDSYRCSLSVTPTGGYVKESVIDSKTNEVISEEDYADNKATLWYLPTEDGQFMIPIRGEVDMEDGNFNLYLTKVSHTLRSPQP